MRDAANLAVHLLVTGSVALLVACGGDGGGDDDDSGLGTEPLTADFSGVTMFNPVGFGSFVVAPGVDVTITNGVSTVSTTSDAEGNFTIVDAPSGDLMVTLTDSAQSCTRTFPYFNVIDGSEIFTGMAVLDCVEDSNPVDLSNFYEVDETFTAIIQSFESDFRDGTVCTSSGGEFVRRIVLGFPESLPPFEVGDLVRMTTASNEVGLQDHALSVTTALEVLATDRADPCTP